MTVYRGRERVRSGVPVGGIGAGKFEVLPSGLFSGFTFQNNWRTPMDGGDHGGVLGYHLALFTERPGKKRRGTLLQSEPVGRLPKLKDVRYEGVFPRARLTYPVRHIGLDATLDVWSPWIPGDEKDSSLPAAFFTLRLRNPGRRAVRASFVFMGRNVCGDWCVGRKNRVTGDARAIHLEFSNADPTPHDPKQGALRFSFERTQGWRFGFIESWNAVTKNFSFNASTLRLEAFEAFLAEGRLPGTRSKGPVRGENEEICGAISASRDLKPGQTAELRFAAAWHFPRHPFGHRYAAWFPSAKAVSNYALARRASLESRTAAVERAVAAMPFPKWFNESLLANLSPFFSSSWFTRDGRFAFYEAPVACPLMGTVDVGFYGSIPLSFFFPKLEMNQLRQFARSQRSDGYIPHDLGKDRLDLPSDGTTFYRWKDLNSKFTLMAWRDALWSCDWKFAREMYPVVKRAMRWAAGTDRDGNGLPDNEGADQTFDLWEIRGTSAYTSGIYLAALLAARRMAYLAGDAAFARECDARFKKGSESFERELWNGRWFGSNCSLSQLNGQWYASLLGLGYVASPVKVRAALKEILRRNGRFSRWGMVNSVLADGSLDRSNDHSKNVWSGMNYAFMSLCVAEGFPVAPLFRQARKLWDNVTRVQKSPWNQPDTVDRLTGRYLFGDAYYRNMAIWSIPLAAALRDARVRRSLLEIRAAGEAQ